MMLEYSQGIAKVELIKILHATAVWQAKVRMSMNRQWELVNGKSHTGENPANEELAFRPTLK